MGGGVRRKKEINRKSTKKEHRERAGAYLPQLLRRVPRAEKERRSVYDLPVSVVTRLNHEQALRFAKAAEIVQRAVLPVRKLDVVAHQLLLGGGQEHERLRGQDLSQLLSPLLILFGLEPRCDFVLGHKVRVRFGSRLSVGPLKMRGGTVEEVRLVTEISSRKS